MEFSPTRSDWLGALTLGATANTRAAYLQFYNKASITGAMHEPNR